MAALRFLTEYDQSTGLTPGDKRLNEAFSNGEQLPERRRDVDFGELSTTLGGRPGNEVRRCTLTRANPS
jgi:hypothetical protein